ncbi:MAG: insulinase family protein [Candidatus Palauibacterales bacterium]|nr:insulinase family protein [Candidatus Palauibacterales bacterium]MDP2530637.1 insulinase family protein [Candidatus Palauibacterales bacterium]MDP2583564.1 insulinase family protein [Candidatus Palauibacterales bacterium]
MNAARRTPVLASLLLLGMAGLLAVPAGLMAQQGFPSKAPPPLQPRPVHFPAVGRDTLANGLQLVVVENHEQPVVSVRLYLPAGGTVDPKGEAGLASMTASLIDKGTKTRSADQIASTVEGVGASLNEGADDDFTYVSATTLTRHLPTVLDVFADVVREPIFPTDQLETMRKRELSGLQVQLTQPSILAGRQFSKELYGDHPYARAETPASVKAITRKDLEAFHAERYVPSGALLVFAGDIDLAAARRAAEQYFGAWSGTAPARATSPSPPAPGPTSITLINRPGSVQSEIWMGNLAIRPDNPDAIPLDVMNRILGGGANARLFLILREQKGWTYGAYSQITSPRDRGYFVATAEVRTPVTDSSVNEMLHQIRRMRTQTVPDSEVQTAEDYLTGHFPIAIETPEQVASQVADVLLRGLGIGYLESYRSRVAAVTAADVQRVAREYLHPDSLDIVVVGDAAKLYETLRAIAPVRLQDVEGKPLQPSDLAVKRSAVKLDATRARAGTFDYELMVQGKSFGSYTLTYGEGDQAGSWKLEEKLQAPMGSQTGTYVFQGDLTPISAAEQGGPASTDLHYASGHVTGTATLPTPQGQTREQKIDTDLPDGTLDGSASVAIVLASPLADGFDLQVPIYAAGQGVQQLSAKVTGADSVTVPAGTYQVYTVEVTGQAGQKILFYVTKEAPHLLVKEEFEGRPVTLELTKAGEAGKAGS